MPPAKTINPSGVRTNGFLTNESTLSAVVAASTGSAATSATLSARRPSTVTVTEPSGSPYSIAPLT